VARANRHTSQLIAALESIDAQERDAVERDQIVDSFEEAATKAAKASTYKPKSKSRQPSVFELPMSDVDDSDEEELTDDEKEMRREAMAVDEDTSDEAKDEVAEDDIEAAAIEE